MGHYDPWAKTRAEMMERDDALKRIAALEAKLRVAEEALERIEQITKPYHRPHGIARTALEKLRD